MGRVVPTRRSRSAGVRQAVAAWAAAVVLLVLSGCEVDTYSPVAFELVNRDRQSAGLGPLQRSPVLDARAQVWSAVMRDAWVASGCGHTTGHLRHSPDLVAQHWPALVVPDWSRVGENVGVVHMAPGGPATSVRTLHHAYMDSSSHRANILGRWTHVGIGSVTGPTAEQLAAGACPGTRVDSVMWNTQAFVK